MSALTFNAAFASITVDILGDVSVETQGAKKCDAPYIEALVQDCINEQRPMDWQSLDPARLRQCVMNSRLFSEAEVEIDSPAIKLKLKERWTLIPLPYYSRLKNEDTFGVTVLESNLFGRGKTMALGGALSDSEHFYFLFYADPSVMFTDYAMNVNLHESSSDARLMWKGQDLDGFNVNETSASASAGYRFSNKTRASLEMIYKERRYESLGDRAKPDDYESSWLGARASYDGADFKFYYNDGLSAHVNYKTEIDRSDNQKRASELNAVLGWQGVAAKDHALQLMVTGAYAEGGRTDYLMLGDIKGFRGIEKRGLWTKKAAAVAVDYHVPLSYKSYGTWTVAPFFDMGFFKPVDSSTGDHYTAYGAGVYMYLKKVNFPGFGLVWGRNENFMGSFVALHVGLRMR